MIRSALAPSRLRPGTCALLALCLGLGQLQPSSAASCDPRPSFADGLSPLRERFVSPNGSDSTGDGTRAKPYQRVSRALQGWRPGDAVRMLPGVYPASGSFSGLIGTSNAPIWIGGVAGLEQPIIRGGSLAFQFSKVRYLVLENLIVEGATANGINCDDGSDYANENATRFLIFRNLTIRDIGTGGNQDGLKLSGVNDYWVMDCTFLRGSAGGSGIDHVGCHRGRIVGCSFTDMGGNAIQCKGGSEDIEIRGNRFSNAGGRAINIGGSTGFEFFRPPLSRTTPNTEARNIRVLANVFVGSEAPLAFVGVVGAVAANNTLIEPTKWVARILQETVSGNGYTFLPCASNRFVNNIISFRRSQVSTHINVGGNTSPTTFTFENNLWYAADAPAQSRPSLPVAERNGFYGLDPRFRAPATRDYSIPTNSPAVGRGASLAFLKADLAQNCYAKAPSLGAFEGLPPDPGSVDSDQDLLPDDWEFANGLDSNNPADAASDVDGDLSTALAEYVAGTDPRDPNSRFTLRAARLMGNSISFRYATVPGRRYKIEAREAQDGGTWVVKAERVGTGNEDDYQETRSFPVGGLFRVRIELP